MEQSKPTPVQKLRHNLKTPIATINWFCEILKDSNTGVMNPKQIDCLQEIEKASQKMLALVNSEIQEENIRKILDN